MRLTAYDTGRYAANAQKTFAGTRKRFLQEKTRSPFICGNEINCDYSVTYA